MAKHCTGKKKFLRECQLPSKSWKRVSLGRTGLWRRVQEWWEVDSGASLVPWLLSESMPCTLGPGSLGLDWIWRPDELFFSFLLECSVTVVFLNLTSCFGCLRYLFTEDPCGMRAALNGGSTLPGAVTSLGKEGKNIYSCPPTPHTRASYSGSPVHRFFLESPEWCLFQEEMWRMVFLSV